MGNCGRKKSPQPNSTILSEEEIRLLLQNTKLDRKEINDLHANFLQTCPTGRMTKKDFLRFFKEVHPAQNKREKADKFCDYVFNVIDRKKKGYISFEDFVLCLSLTSHGDFREKCEFAFKLYDLDRDGKLNKKEMTKVLTALYDLSGIENRKGENAPAKKVDEIVKKINQKHYPGVSKPPSYITREQFIDACCNDNYIKNLFMDPIFVFRDANRPTVVHPQPQPQPQPVPSPQVIHKPVVDIPSIYIESRPDPTVHSHATTAPPQVIIDDKPLALYLDEKETFDFVDKYLAEMNTKRAPAYVQDTPINYYETSRVATSNANPTGIDIDIKPLDYLIDHHQPYEIRYDNNNISTEDLRQEIKHLI